MIKYNFKSLNSIPTAQMIIHSFSKKINSILTKYTNYTISGHMQSQSSTNSSIGSSIMIGKEKMNRRDKNNLYFKLSFSKEKLKKKKHITYFLGLLNKIKKFSSIMIRRIILLNLEVSKAFLKHSRIRIKKIYNCRKIQKRQQRN